jgi:predicted transcriptional regulator
VSAISIRLPDSLHRKVREVAHKNNVSINQMITLAVAEKLSALETEDFLGKRAQRATKARFGRALKKVSDRKPESFDKI